MQEQTALTRVTSLLLLRQRLFRGAERRAPAQVFARHAGEEPRHALAAFQVEPQSRLQAVRRAGVADPSDAVAEGIVAAALDRRRQRLHRHAVAAEEAVAGVAGVFLVRQALR